MGALLVWIPKTKFFSPPMNEKIKVKGKGFNKNSRGLYDR